MSRETDSQQAFHVNYEREKRIEDNLDTWSKATIRFFVLTNAGAAAAALGFIGASGQGSWAALPVALFVAGLVLAGLAMSAQWSRAYAEWHGHHFPGADAARNSWFLKVGMWVEPRTGKFVGGSLLVFILGALLGLVMLACYQSPAPPVPSP